MILVPETDYKKQKHNKRKKNKSFNLKPCKKVKSVKHKLAFLNAPARRVYKQHRAAVKSTQDVAKLTLAPKETDASSLPDWRSTPSPARENSEGKTQDAVPAVLKKIPMQHHARAKKILDTLLKRGYRYTTEKRIQLPNGRVLAKTNITDILRAASVKDYRGKANRPVGWTEFLDSIIRYRVPQSVFTKNSVKADLEERSKYYSSESDVSTVWETFL